MINDVCLDELYDLRYLLLVAIASRLLTVKQFLILWQIPPVSCAVGNDDDYVLVTPQSTIEYTSIASVFQ